MSVRPEKTEISLGICPVWSESSLCAQWAAKGPVFLHADSQDSDQTGRMPRLIWVFVGCTVILLVLSCRGTIMSHVKVPYSSAVNVYTATQQSQIWGFLYEASSISIYEPPHDKTIKVACAPSEDSDQPGHPPSLIRVFTVRLKKQWALSYPLRAQRRLWSDWADAQADLNLCWAHSSFCWFCHEAAHIYCVCEQQRLLLDWANMQARLSLYCLTMWLT